VNRRFAFEPAAREAYLQLRKDPETALYAAVKGVLTELLENPGSERVRRLRYRPDTWAVPVRADDARWLVLWRHDPEDADLIQVHYVDPAPGEL